MTIIKKPKSIQLNYKVESMTRINSCIEPIKLTDNHLIAEIKEVNQLCGSYRKSLNSKYSINNIPSNFTLNTGHVKFFYDKGKYLHNRFNELKYEAIKRGFNIQTEFNRDVWKIEHYNDWYPKNTNIVKNILFERISLRLKNQKNKIRYNRNVITVEAAILILKS